MVPPGEGRMSKHYRDKHKHIGAQARHKGRHVHMLDDIVPIEQLIEEVYDYDEQRTEAFIRASRLE